MNPVRIAGRNIAGGTVHVRRCLIERPQAVRHCLSFDDAPLDAGAREDCDVECLVYDTALYLDQGILAVGYLDHQGQVVSLFAHLDDVEFLSDEEHL